MGRLFWKCFFAFWCALLVAGVGVGVSVWLHQQGERQAAERGGGPHASMLLQAASRTLQYGGGAALRTLLDDWQREAGHGPSLRALDEASGEWLSPPASTELLAAATHEAKDPGAHPWAVRVSSPAGRQYLLFATDHRPGPPPGAPHEPHPRPGPGGPPPPLLHIAAGLLASLIFSALLAWYLAAPIRHLRWAFAAAADGRLETRVQPLMGTRKDELADLGRDFDRMASRLQNLLQAQQRLLHDVSHELRSPLARLQSAVGLVRQSPEKREQMLDRMENEVARLDQLVGELLTLCRLDSGASSPERQRVDLVELIASIADDASFEARSTGRELHFIGSGVAEARVQQELLSRAFENVMRNAVKFTPLGTVVEVVVRIEEREGGRCLQLSVADHGPGVPEGELELMFEPFYRGATGQQADGFGLGLAIARRAIVAHGGDIRARNRPEGGLLLEITLPLPME